VPIDGRNRMIYWSYSGRPIYITNGAHAAGNGAIQGTARELLVDGTLNWRKTPWGRLPLLPVHDQLLGMVPAAEAEEATSVLAQCMDTYVLSSPGFEVHIGADVDRPFRSWPDSSLWVAPVTVRIRGHRPRFNARGVR
jgi:DNA polymerase I-like protein with 3'-5' exonuclease and polymerase domains